MSATLALREALTESISSGQFEDVKIILYSRRDRYGNVCVPRALYASSKVSKTVPHFKNRVQPKDFSEAIDDSETAEDYDYHSDSDLEEDDDHVAHSAKPLETVAPPRDHNRSSPSTEDDRLPRTYGEHKEHLQQGYVIKIKDVAFLTFQAFLLCLYTGKIEFAPYGSVKNRKSRVAEMFSISEDAIPRPSPKSIYRLADKYDVPGLKKVALEGIIDGLNHCDLVEEAFSKFASKYKQVRIAQVTQLAALWFRGRKGPARGIGERVDEKIDSYASGELCHARETVTLLWEHSRRPKDLSPDPENVFHATGVGQYYSRFNPPQGQRSVTAELPVHQENCKSAFPSLIEHAAGTQPQDVGLPWFLYVLYAIVRKLLGFFSDMYFGRSSRDSRPLKTALIKSIREGVFFDKKYWVRNVHSSRAPRPIYISSVVAGERLRRIDDLVMLRRKDEPLDIGLVIEDSDFWGGPGSQANPEEKEKPELLPTLTVGSFTSWLSLFFYLCTETIQFAPLASQGTDVRARYVQENTRPGKPHPCSPKVIYSLAKALEIETLRDLALEDIRSKVSSENVVSELFSGFTSRETDVMKMECQLLGSKLTDKSTTASATRFITYMASGQVAHRAGALKLALRNGRSTVSTPSSSTVGTA